MATTTTKTSPTQGGRTVVGLMVVAVLFSLVGKTAQGGGAAKVALTDGQIIMGGGVATAILTLISHGGELGREIAVGMALVVLTSSALVYGGPVWKAISSLTGQSGALPATNQARTTPTTPTAIPTTPTGVTR